MQSELEKGILRYVDNSIENAPYTQVYTGLIKSSGVDGYTISLNGVEYANVPSKGTFLTNDTVRVVVPNNQYSNMFILSDSTGGSGTGTVSSVNGMTGDVTISNVPSSDKFSSPKTITLTGDVTGNISTDFSANPTISVTVVDDSHNHIVSNVDGLQTALDGKSPIASPTFTGVVTAPRFASTIATGTAPLTVASTTLVTNLNADLLDGLNSASTNTVSTIVARDSSGNFSAGTITANLTGNSSTSTKLATARNISLSGDVTGSVSFDGSGNSNIVTTVVDDSHNHIISNVDNLQTTLNIKADLVDGKVPSSQLPSFVDDVLEYATLSAFPTTGTSGVIYVDLSTNLAYRWSGTVYVEISPSLALGETSSTAYRGDRGVIAYNHSLSTSNPHSTTASQVGLGNVPNVTTNNQTPTFTMAGTDSNLVSGETLTISLGKISKAINSLISHISDSIKHITSIERTNWNTAYTNNHTHSNKTILDNTTASYTTAEQTKLSGIENGAEVNNISDTNATDLTDGGDTTLHYHTTDRNRANHTGTQLASTISDFASTVRSTVLTGLSTATNAVISATDTVLSALGKLQKQISDNLTTLTSHTSNKSNPHSVTKTQVGLSDVPNVTTNNQTPSYTMASGNADLVSGETLTIAFGKIAKSINNLISHIADNIRHITSIERTNWNVSYTNNHTHSNKTILDNTTASYIATDKTKLDGIESGAQVNDVTGVKGDSEGSYRVGNVNITKTNIGLGSVDNTSDATKPISTPQQTALNLKLDKTGDSKDNVTTFTQAGALAVINTGEKHSVMFGKIRKAIADLISHIGNTTNPHSVTKTQVGLGNVDNTSDATKKVLSATKLTTARTINGVGFDGTANIKVLANPKLTMLNSGSLDNVLANGFYNGGGANAVTKKPSGVDSFGLIVYKTAGGYTTQDLIEGNANSQKRWSRQFNGSTWSSWIQIYTSLHKQPDVAKLTTARTISLTGDVTGSVSFDGSANVSITSTVADDSHNHVISNVDNLQTTLDAKAPLVSPSLAGTPLAPTATQGTNTTQIATTAFVQTAINTIDPSTDMYQISGTYTADSIQTMSIPTIIDNKISPLDVYILLDGFYNRAILGIDYTYKIATSTSIAINILTAGAYVINYGYYAIGYNESLIWRE